MSDPLVDVMLPTDTSDSLALRVGTISGTTPTEVELGGQSGLDASCLGWYTPVIGHTVAILQTKTALLVLGNMTSITVIALTALIGEMLLGRTTPGG